MKSVLILTLILGSFAFAQTPDWSENAVVPTGGRPNPYAISGDLLHFYKHKGQVHTQIYPVSVTGTLLPERPIKRVLDNDFQNPIKKFFLTLFNNLSGIEDFKDLFRWLGLNPYPKTPQKDLYNFSIPENIDISSDLLGYSRLQKNGVKVFTMSCATCHSSQLFGTTILGMTNRFPRANHFFLRGIKGMQAYNSNMFRLFAKATEPELQVLDETKRNLRSVGVKKPLLLGLDTSLAQVALSLNHRAPNAWADKDPYFEAHPRPDMLDRQAGDSKPAVWWNLKYKNRWLSDGSVISGNPIFMNILWNEIGRGTDLRQLDQWLNQNEQVIQELTTAVFQTQSPRIEDFFPAEKIEKSLARRGEALFNMHCSKCHGEYVKNWSLEEFQNKPWSEQIKTAQVLYPTQTRVRNVGTDPNRARMMKSLEKLNDLEISRRNGMVIRAGEGYVPPPLVGIWARWPYLHNNSIPSLCALLTPAAQRPKAYYSGLPVDRQRDFDFECNGYPLGQRTPQAWKKKEHLYVADRPGLYNTGHDEGILVKDGREFFTQLDKRALIQFLQTL